MNLYQLVYTSIREKKCTENEIEKILSSCRANNPKHNVTGVLLHSENQFIQYLEGGKDIINLYDHIKTDPRHRSVVLLSYGPLAERVFPSWQMGYKNLSKKNIDFLTDSSLEDKKVFSSLIKGEKQVDTSAVKLLVKFFSKN